MVDPKTTPQRQVVIPFALVGADQNPNVSRNAVGQSAAYARAAVVTFATLRRWNPDLSLIWFSNGPMHELLADAAGLLGVQTVTSPFAHRPPQGFMPTFAGSLFLLDAIEHLSNRGEGVLFLDPDIVCTRSLDGLFRACDGVGALPNPTEENEWVNGVDASCARLITRAMGEGRTFERFIGGEILLLPPSGCETFIRDVEFAFQAAVDSAAVKELHFTTEEHLFSYALSGREFVDLTPFVKRMWTAARHRTVETEDRELALWHLPAEKGKGFDALYREIGDSGGWFWSAPPATWRRKAASLLGLWHRAPQRWVRDEVGSAARKLSARLS